MNTWIRWQASSALRELARGRTWLALLGGLLLALLFALLERRAAPAFALDRALLGANFGLVLPLGCYWLTARGFAGDRDRSLAAVVRFGVDRRLALLGRFGVVLATALIFAVLVAGVTLVAAGPTWTWGREVLALLWISGASGLGLTALLLLGTSFGRHGPLVCLILDWLLGSSNGLIGLPWPRAHVQNLLGGAPVLALSQTQSALMLVTLAGAFVVGALFRTRP